MFETSQKNYVSRQWNGTRILKQLRDVEVATGPIEAPAKEHSPQLWCLISQQNHGREHKTHPGLLKEPCWQNTSWKSREGPLWSMLKSKQHAIRSLWWWRWWWWWLWGSCWWPSIRIIMQNKNFFVSFSATQTTSEFRTPARQSARSTTSWSSSSSLSTWSCSQGQS